MNDVQPYAFGRQGPVPSAAIGGLEKLGDRLARRLRGIVEPFSGGRPLVSAKPLDDTMFMMWDACVPAFVNLSIYRLPPIKGPVTLRIDAELVSLLVDRFYGGHGKRLTGERREFTPTEVRLSARLAEQIMAALVQCWSEIVPVEVMLVGRETNVAHAELMAGETPVLVQSFEIDIGDRTPGLIEIVYPKDGFAGLELPGGSKVPEELRVADPLWQRQLSRRLEDVRFSARTVLARPNLKISELVALKPGDVIPIHIARNLPLLIGDRIFAQGTIGEQDGCAAFMIEKLA
ncbi:flagellar motor switch protein FliM [Sphingobium sp. SYK-6]|uniref:flagellar motor switch protein FliM n=1 Tax=Sphingobium sp. (strain NBRC 103272 / SYK-6) TaxID=627192 RepID=UPI0002276D4F|nr:FliM/FliN family flagellar motor switch protein [Sphingobium sp. SYK-6]BAK64961.1 flagellar motor switch protein FliM [Sphingobium sp. SYK-6]